MAFHSQFIIWMYLNGKICLGVNKFDQQWKFSIETSVIFFTYQFSPVFVYYVCETLAGITAVGNNGFIARDIGYFPAFAYLLLPVGEMLERNYLVSAPDCSLKNGPEF